MWHISQDPYLNPQPRNIPSSQESPDSTTPRFINHQDDMLAQTFGLFVDTERTPVFGDPWASAETPSRVEEMMSSQASEAPASPRADKKPVIQEPAPLQHPLRKRASSLPVPTTTTSKPRRDSSLPPIREHAGGGAWSTPQPAPQPPQSPPHKHRETPSLPFTSPLPAKSHPIQSPPPPPAAADSFNIANTFHLAGAPRFPGQFEPASSAAAAAPTISPAFANRGYNPAALAAAAIPPPPPSARPSFSAAKATAISALAGHCVPELQCALRARGLPVSGLRHDLLERLGEDLARERTHTEGNSGETREEVELSRFRVPELKEMCRERGLSVGGLKGDLKRRLCRSSF